jgi:uncharacterized delta-60 repeat protein
LVVSRRRVIRVVAGLAATAVAAAALASGVSGAAAGGGLDRSFGDRGFVEVPGITSCLTGEGGCAVGIGLAVQRDGAVVVAAGTLEPDCRSRFAVARLRGGTLDQTFGRAGGVLTGFGSSAAIANAVAVTGGGKIVVAGERQTPTQSCGDHIHLGGGDGFALARYHRDGTPDRSFGGVGTTFTPMPGCDSSGPCRGGAGVTDVLLQRDGKIVAIGSTHANAALARYTLAGELDRSFGNQGLVVLRTGDRGSGEAGRPALDAAGRIILPLTPGCWPCEASVVRFNRDGTLDRTFGVRGRARIPLIAATAVETTPHGILVVGLQERDGPGRAGDRIAVVRLSSAGKLRRGYGRNGMGLPPMPTMNWVYDTAITGNGKLVVVATRLAIRQKGVYALSRLTANGSPDRSFGSSGIATVELGEEHGSGRRVAIQQDGKLIVASMVGMSRPVLTVTRHLP